MKKRILGAMLIVMTLFIMPSCSLEEAMRAFGSNITGPSEESKEAIAKALDYVDRSFSEDWTDTSFKAFADSISAINGNPAAINQYVKEMSRTLPKDSTANTEGKNFINDIVDEVRNMSDGEVDLGSIQPGDIPDTGNAVFNDAISKAVDAFQTLRSDDYTLTYGDALLLKAVDYAMVKVQEYANGGSVDMDNVLDLASSAVPVLTTVLPSTALKDIDLGGLLNEVVKMATSGNSGEEETV